MLTFIFQMFNIKPPKETKPMSWNYRIIQIPSDDEEGDVFVIREVYYDDADEILFWTEGDAAPIGSTYQEVSDDCDKMLEAFNKPVLFLTEDEDGEPTLIEVEEEEDEE